MASVNEAANNKSLLEDSERKSPPYTDLVGSELMPGGRIHVQMVSSLSDQELLSNINSKFTPAYSYEYAEKLNERGQKSKALQFAYLGTITPSPSAFKADGNNLRYKTEYLREVGGYLPSACLAAEICGDAMTTKPLDYQSCPLLRTPSRLLKKP